MRPLLALGLTAACFAAAITIPARAEFLLGGQANAGSGIPLAATLPPIAEPSAAPVRRPVAVPVAKGFGEQVSLRFAARQIVPSEVALAIADNVDATTNVNWQGDRPWNRVLQDVLKPLDLRLTISGKTALISR